MRAGRITIYCNQNDTLYIYWVHNGKFAPPLPLWTSSETHKKWLPGISH